MSGISSGKKWDHPKLIQKFVSSAMGLLVVADVMSLRVPLYFFGQATDRVGDVFHSVARLVRHGLSDIFDKIETGSITVSDALYLISGVDRHSRRCWLCLPEESLAGSFIPSFFEIKESAGA
jgi:hypothetical protein